MAQLGMSSPEQRGVLTRWLPVEVAVASRLSDPETPETPGSGPGSGGEARAAEGSTGAGGGRSDSAGAPLAFAVSVESEDRAGDLIVASGWDLRAYERNPIVLWAHQHLAPPIGRSLKTWVEGRSLMAMVEFAPSAFAQEVRRLYEGGFLRGVSVGFRAIETEQRQSQSGRRGVLFKKQELLEISAAPVPLHPDTLALSPSGRFGADGSLSAREGARGWAGDAGYGPSGEEIEALGEIRRLWREIADVAGV